MILMKTIIKNFKFRPGKAVYTCDANIWDVKQEDHKFKTSSCYIANIFNGSYFLVHFHLKISQIAYLFLIDKFNK